MGGKRNLNFWRSDWFVGLLVSTVVFALGSGNLLQNLERKAYDMGVGLTQRTPSERIAVIAIDKQSLDHIGRWPWSRDIFADMIEKLAAAKARVIATPMLFSEPQVDAGLGYIQRLIELNTARLARNAAVVAEQQAAQREASTRTVQQGQGAFRIGAGKWLPAPSSVELPPVVAPAPMPPDPMGMVLAEAEEKLNTDRHLATALGRAGNVVLPVLFHLGEPGYRTNQPLPEFMRKNTVKVVAPEEDFLLPALDLDAGVTDTLGPHAAAIGHLNGTPDPDGALRTEVLAVDHFGQVIPSLSLLTAAKSLHLGPGDIQVRPGAWVKLGRLKISTDATTRMRPFYYSATEGKPAFSVDSFFDVQSGKIPYAKYRDKIVLIGPTTANVGSRFATPLVPDMPAVLMQAHAVSSILSEHFFVAPAWGGWAEKAAFLAVALYLILLLPRLPVSVGVAVTALLLALLVVAHFGLMMTQLIWLQLMVPATLLLAGHLLLTTKRFLVTEQYKEKENEKSGDEPAESNRMLGLAFQGQGQLDMAFDKFRKCPLDDPLMENLYNLGIDFERKHEFKKAEAVFRYMADYNLDFRDLAHRIARARQMSETAVSGDAGAGNSGADTTIVDDGAAEKPMLGRYRIEKELGKGAMGVVYLGRDPNINRMAAIKTMALSQEFDEEEIKDIKERFFREAETAGRLNHPNIVTMFDAGEEHDLAYIALEFIEGGDLAPHTKPDRLLPLPKTMEMVACVADALDYAHANHVVHRDIKPANLMYERETGQVKVTDFGIARITDSSKTKTGVVLGTPSYMSPEQLAGKKVDGRSDLFSLGVTLYQFCCGQLPFVGESMAQLMFKIASDPHPDIRTLVRAMPECLAKTIDKALEKDPDRRYQTGAELAHDLRACLETMKKAD